MRSPHRASIFLAVPVLAFLSLAGCAREGVRPGRPHVILILIDTLRAKHLGCYGYERDTSPFLDGLAARGLRFEHAVSPAPWTAPAVASLFTSFYPAAHGVLVHVETGEPLTRSAVLSDEFITLAEALGESGYRTVGLTANAWVADYLGFAQGFETFATRDYEVAGRLNEDLYGMLRPLRRDGRPLFLYLHYMDPHAPYDPPEGTAFEGAVRRYDYPPADLENVNRYDGEIRYLDARLRELFGFLEGEGYLEDAVVILTSDHGEQFGEYGRTGHGHTVHNAEVHVPLIIMGDGVRPGTVSRTVSLVDIYPTLLELLDLPLDRPVQGISLLRDPAAGARPGVLAGATLSGSFKALTRGDGTKLILSFGGPPDGPAERGEETGRRAYDSRRDYWERRDLKNPVLLESLASEFYALYEQSAKLREQVTVRETDLDEETLRRLKALGYVN